MVDTNRIRVLVKQLGWVACNLRVVFWKRIFETFSHG